MLPVAAGAVGMWESGILAFAGFPSAEESRGNSLLFFGVFPAFLGASFPQRCARLLGSNRNSTVRESPTSNILGCAIRGVDAPYLMMYPHPVTGRRCEDAFQLNAQCVSSVLSPKFVDEVWLSEKLLQAPLGRNNVAQGREPWVNRASPRLRHPSPARAGEGRGRHW